MHNVVAPGPAHESMAQARPNAAAEAMITEAALVAGAWCDEGRLMLGQLNDSSECGHDMLHLCLAILAAALGLFLTGLLGRRAQNATRHHEPSSPINRAGRGPPFALRSRDLLTILSVQRV
jgi:hypothetical protein